MEKAYWEEFLEKYAHLDAHFHGEGNPPDLVLEMRPEVGSQEWLWVWRPNGCVDTADLRDGMCKEMMNLESI